jgi:hypothetical protein
MLKVNKNIALSRLLKEKYLIEPAGFAGWIFRREGSDNIIKRAKHRLLLISFANDYCGEKQSDLVICDENGLMEELRSF